MRAVSFKNIDTHLSHIDTAITDIVKIFEIYFLLTNKRKKERRRSRIIRIRKHTAKLGLYEPIG